MSIMVGDIRFDGPYLLSTWKPPQRAGVYVIMMKDVYRLGKDKILYVGESSNFSERGFLTNHHKYDCWLKYAGSADNLYICVHLMPNSTHQQRKAIESALIEQYKPICNSYE